MAIDTSGNFSGHLRDQKYVGGNNDAGNLMAGFLATYLKAKELQDEEVDEFNESTEQGREGHNLTMQMLGQGGMIPGELVEQTQLTPVERKQGGLERFAKAFLGNQHEFQDLALKSKAAQLEGQQLQNKEMSSYLDDTAVLQQKLSQLRQGIDVDGMGLKNPKSIQSFEAAKNKYVADQRIVKDGNDLNALVNGISGDAWAKPETFDSLVRFRAEHPFLNQQQSNVLKDSIAHVRKNIEVKGDGAIEDIIFKEDPITGERFAIRGKSTLRSGTNPAFTPSKFDTMDYASLLRRQEALEKDIRKGTNAMGVPFSATEMRALREQREAIENQLKTTRPGQKPITAPNVSLQQAQNPEADAQRIIQEANDAIKRGAKKSDVYDRLRELGLEITEDKQQ